MNDPLGYNAENKTRVVAESSSDEKKQEACKGEEMVRATKIATTQKFRVTASPGDCFYDSGRKEYIAMNASGRWLPLNESQFKRRLRSQGISNKVPDGALISPVEEKIIHVQDQQDVQFAGPLAGCRQGFTEQNGTRLLVTSSPSLIEPIAGDWSILSRLIQGLLGAAEQRDVFFSWLKLSVQQVRTGQRQPGQALVFAGPAGCGKSLLQAIITEALGGRSAKAHMFLAGRTDFNAELFGAEHLILEDEFMSTKTSERLKLGAAIKGLAVNDVHPCHRKGATIVNLRPLWRISISVNDDAEAMMVLPPMDDHLADKFILLKCQRRNMPMPTNTGEERQAFWKKLQAELPSLLAYLNEWAIPASLADRRYGVRSYHNSDLAKELDELAPEAHLLELIDAAKDDLFDKDGRWRGTANELKRTLMDNHKVGSEARKLLDWRNATGTYLGRLARRSDRVENRRSGESREWLIHLR